MFFALSKLIDALLSPLWWALLLGALGLRWRGREPSRARKWAARSGIAALVFFSIGHVSFALLRSLEATSLTTMREDDAPFDAVVVLGGIVDEHAMRSAGDAPSLNDNVERVLEAVRLVRRGRARNVLVAAGSLAPSPSRPVEAHVLRALLRDWGIDEQRVAIDDRSRNTRENAVEAARVARERGWSRLVVVTSALHGRRARGCFRAVGLDPRWLIADRRAPVHARWTSADGWIPRAKNLALSEMVLREMAGWWIYRAQGYARP